MTRALRLYRHFLDMFTERHLYIRSGDIVRGFVLTPARQIALLSILVALTLWFTFSTISYALDAIEISSTHRELAQMQARSERWVADREARLNSAVTQLNASSGSMDSLATAVEKRHAALTALLADARTTPGVTNAIAPELRRAIKAPTSTNPVARIAQVEASQERLISATDSFAKGRADRLRLAFRLAGLTPSSFVPRSGALGGPLIEGRDPRALATVLDVDEGFAERIQHAANSLSEAQALSAAAARLPLSKPTQVANKSSNFGFRIDPFTSRPAFHSGMDFMGGIGSPIYSTAPGVVSFTGVRSGYGNTIEIDHGAGFKTRYAHLSGIGVGVGQRVAVGQRIGALGNTGRSTGPHLHYEVWVNGQAKNPDRFVKAGEYVQQTRS